MTDTKSILWICANQDAALKRSNMFEFDRPRRFVNMKNTQRIIWPGAALCGVAFDEIILDNFDPYRASSSETETQRMADWFDDSVRCRLCPGGKISTLKDFEPHLD